MKYLLLFVLVLPLNACASVEKSVEKFMLREVQDTDITANETAELRSVKFPSSLAASEDTAIISPDNLIDEQQYNGYTARVYRNKGPGVNGAFQILKGDSLLFSQEGYFFRIGLVHGDMPEGILVEMGNNITKDGMPNLVVSEWSDEVSCDYNFYVFLIGKDFRLLDKINAGQDDCAMFKDIDRDGVLEFCYRDLTFNYWHASLKNSPKPNIIYEYRDGKYSLAMDTMERRLPLPEDVERKIKDIQSQIESIGPEIAKNDVVNDIDNPYYSAWIKDGTIIPSEVWGYMLELIYSGHYHEAWEFLDRVWPQDKSGKENIVIEFKSQLARSKYWKEIAKGILKPETKN